MWIACTNRDTIKVAARNGLGALAFSFVDPEEARQWSKIYYDIIKSEECVPIGHRVNANLALHQDREEAIRRGHEGFEFFGYALNALVAHDTVPGRTNLWGEYLAQRGDRTEQIIAKAKSGDYPPSGIGTPDDMRQHIRNMQAAGVDQMIIMQQAGRNKNEHIRESLELFAAEVMPEFKAVAAVNQAKKDAELAPYIEAALARKRYMEPLGNDNVPVVKASVAKAIVGQGSVGQGSVD